MPWSSPATGPPVFSFSLIGALSMPLVSSAQFDATTWANAVDHLLSHYVEARTTAPVFIVDYPVELSPFSKRKPDDPSLVERFEPICNGMELGNGYSELNDAIDQRQRFDHEAALVAGGDVEAHPADADFLYALEVGLPPTGGIGIGVDRLVMLIAEVAAIRDVILFPLLRPEDGS
jgi:lysyl-tRNA synthetase class 2